MAVAVLAKLKLSRGSATQDENLEGLPQEDARNGCILTCSTKPQSSLEIEATYYPEFQQLPGTPLAQKT